MRSDPLGVDLHAIIQLQVKIIMHLPPLTCIPAIVGVPPSFEFEESGELIAIGLDAPLNHSAHRNGAQCAWAG